MKKVIVLGASGSIGSNTLDVIRSRPESFCVAGLSVHSDPEVLRSLGKEFPGSALAFSSKKISAPEISFSGQDAVLQLIRETEADIVVNGISGAAGLLPSVVSLETGKDLALANKETIVMAGSFVLDLARKMDKKVLPVDSEHSAIFHLINAHGTEAIHELVLTASGGPFRNFTAEQLANVSVKDALAHPTWKMGGKISIDSASLANKGLEVIEAVKLFNVPPQDVKVVVHPESKVHSLVRLRDGSLYAQISNPDMRVPIHNALFHPFCTPCDFGHLDLEGLSFTFSRPNMDLFPMLPLAYAAAEKAALYPTAYNAANEVAVAAFFENTIRFIDIPRITEHVLSFDWTPPDNNLEAILDADTRARSLARKVIQGASV